MSNKEKKRLIAESMQALESAVFSQDIALVYEQIDTLEKLTSSGFTIAILHDIATTNKGTGNVLIDDFLQDILKEVQ
jgi:hypothetical protein